MDIEKLILKATEYGGDKRAGQKAISASSLNKPLLQLWLRYKYGVIPAEKVTMATLGSLLHLGMEKVCEGKFTTEADYEAKLWANDEEWKLTGTIDAIELGEDGKPKTIYDWKTIKRYRVETLKKHIEEDPWSDDYIVQMNVYAFLIMRKHSVVPEMKIVTLSPDAGLNSRKGIEEPFLEIIDIPDLGMSQVGERVVQTIQDLQWHIKEGSVPPRCEDTWPRKVNGTTVPLRCMYFCSYQGYCPHYNPKPETVTATWEF